MSWDTRSLCHKLISQGPALRILVVRGPYPRVPVPGSWMSWFCVPGSQSHRFPGPRVLDSGSQVSGSRVSGSQVSGSWVSGADLRLCQYLCIVCALNRTGDQFEFDVLGFVFVLILFTCTVRLLFHSLLTFTTAHTRV